MPAQTGDARLDGGVNTVAGQMVDTVIKSLDLGMTALGSTYLSGTAVC
jgi:hypothetical protein